MIWDWSFAILILPYIVRGLVETLEALLGGTMLALTLGLAWTLVNRYMR
jgi:hypothetical protein